MSDLSEVLRAAREVVEAERSKYPGQRESLRLDLAIGNLALALLRAGVAEGPALSPRCHCGSPLNCEGDCQAHPVGHRPALSPREEPDERALADAAGRMRLDGTVYRAAPAPSSAQGEAAVPHYAADGTLRHHCTPSGCPDLGPGSMVKLCPDCKGRGWGGPAAGGGTDLGCRTCGGSGRAAPSGPREDGR